MSLPVDWTGAPAAALAAGTLRPAILLRVATYPYRIRLWSGLGDLILDADLIEDLLPGGYPTHYLGMGFLTGVPMVSQLINGLAERADFTLAGTGITGEMLALASGSAVDIRGVQVNLGVVVFDAQWVRMAPPLWIWEGVADSLRVVRTSGGGSDPVRSIILSVGSLMTGRRRPGVTYFTDPDQRRRSNTDSFFDRVKLYSVGSTKTWPQ